MYLNNTNHIFQLTLLAQFISLYFSYSFQIYKKYHLIKFQLVPLSIYTVVDKSQYNMSYLKKFITICYLVEHPFTISLSFSSGYSVNYLKISISFDWLSELMIILPNTNSGIFPSNRIKGLTIIAEILMG